MEMESAPVNANENTGSAPAPAATAPRHHLAPYGIIGVAAIIVIAFGVFLTWHSYGGKSRSASTAPRAIKIGILQNVQHLDPVVDGFKEGMQDLAAKEGATVTFDYQNANGDLGEAAAITKQFVNEHVDLILAITPPAITTAWNTLHSMGDDTKIPIVFTNGNGLVESGFFPSFETSGKNMTGLIPDDNAVSVKKLEFFKEIQPTAKKIGVFFGTGPGTQPAAQALAALEKAAPDLGITIVKYPIAGDAADSPDVMQKIADSIKAGDVDAFITVPDPVSNYADNPEILINLSKRINVPIYWLTQPRVYEWGLLSYSQDYPDSGEHAAAMANEVLNGTPAQSIPMETSSKNLLVINMKVANALGLTIPDDILYQASDIITATSSTSTAQ